MVEVDGAQHMAKEQGQKDVKRDEEVICQMVEERLQV